MGSNKKINAHVEQIKVLYRKTKFLLNNTKCKGNFC